MSTRFRSLVLALSWLAASVPAWPGAAVPDAGAMAGGDTGSLRQANKLLENEEYEKAAAAYEALGVQPQAQRECWRLNNLALCHLRLKEPARAVPLLEKAVEMDPSNFIAWSNLGAAYELVGDKVKAIDLYKKALSELKQAEKKPLPDPEAKDNAVAGQEKKELNPEQLQEGECTLPWAEMADALQKAKDLLIAGRNDEAAAAYAKIGSTRPAVREGWRLNNWGLCYLNQNDFQKALPRFLKSVEAYPDNAIAWNNLGVAYENLGILGKAKEAYLKAVEYGRKTDYDTTKAELNALKIDFVNKKKDWEVAK